MFLKVPYFWKLYKNFTGTQIVIKYQISNLIFFIYINNLKSDGYNMDIFYSKHILINSKRSSVNTQAKN